MQVNLGKGLDEGWLMLPMYGRHPTVEQARTRQHPRSPRYPGDDRATARDAPQPCEHRRIGKSAGIAACNHHHQIGRRLVIGATVHCQRYPVRGPGRHAVNRQVPPAVELLPRQRVGGAKRLEGSGMRHQRKAIDQKNVNAAGPGSVAKKQGNVAADHLDMPLDASTKDVEEAGLAAALFGLSLLREALRGHRGWAPVWRDASPRDAYDVVIIGGGGHGLATAFYLASRYGIRNVAVLEKGWIGGGNVGRNTTIIRSNYLLDGNIPFYEMSMRLWEGLEQELNYNVMVSQRGVLNLAHSDAQRDAYARRGNAMRLHGVDAELLDREGVRRLAPFLNFAAERFPIVAGLLQRRGGTARHDAVAWGYARGASNLGVDIIQNCEVTGFLRDADGRIVGVDSSRGRIRAGKTGMAVAGNSSRLAAIAGFRLPIESHVLQAFVSEALKPVIQVSSPLARAISTSANRTKGGWSLAAISTDTTAMPAAAICRWSRMFVKVAWPSCR
jgi:heterotetrameric sarcosine oxidase beta subunit